MKRLTTIFVLLAWVPGCDVFLPGEGYDGQPCRDTTPECADGLSCLNDICQRRGDVQVVYYVKTGASPGGDGLSWDTAFAHPQDAVDVAGADDEVWVASGSYNRKGSETTLLAMKDGVDIYGGFAGTETSRDARDPIANSTVLNCLNEADCHHVATGASNATLDGFTLRGGNASGAFPNGLGAGMYNDGVTGLTVSHCQFLYNDAEYGGGMYNANCDQTVVISNCAFSRNDAGQDGAGMHNLLSRPLVKNCLFHLNEASRNGGGMFNQESAPNIINCTFADNSAGSLGGAIAGMNDEGGIKNSILWDNSAPQIPDIPPHPVVTHSCVQGGYSGTGNIQNDPRFVSGALGQHYLYHQGVDGPQAQSPCVDAGSDPADRMGLSGLTTRSDGAVDTGQVDMGFHYLR
jgi:hypothetical protein